MKKLLACGLILAMLSSTGAMCFANEEIEVVNAVEVSATEMDEIKETQDEKEIQKEELLNGLGEIKKDSSLTWKEKALRSWEYVKNFVKQHYKAIGFSVLAVLACIFGAKFVGYVLSLINSNDEEAEQERLAKEQAEKELQTKKIVNESDNETINKNQKDSNIEKSGLWSSLWECL